MKRLFILPAGALAAAITLVAGPATAQVTDSTAKTTVTTTVAPETAVKTGPAASDSAIVAALIAANQKEVAAAEVAIAQAQSDRVKEFARRIQRDHAKIIDDLQGYLQKTSGGMASGVVRDSMKPAQDSMAKANVPPQNQPDTAYAKQQPMAEPAQPEAPWAGKTGKDFDKAWVEAMEDDHKEAIDHLRNNIIPRIQDSSLKAMVQGFLPIMGNHLRDVQQLENELK